MLLAGRPGYFLSAVSWASSMELVTSSYNNATTSDECDSAEDRQKISYLPQRIHVGNETHDSTPGDDGTIICRGGGGAVDDNIELVDEGDAFVN